MSASNELILQINCKDLDESRLQNIAREIAKSLRSQNLGAVTFPEHEAVPGKKGTQVQLATSF